MLTTATNSQYGLPCFNYQQPQPPNTSLHFTPIVKTETSMPMPLKVQRQRRAVGEVKCNGISIGDFIGGDLIKFDLGRWLSDVEEHKALAIYTPHEGGYEGRYLSRLRYQGYYFLDLTARGLGDPETTLTKVHPVCPAHVGKQPIARWYFPPEVDYRLEALPPDAKGLVVWIIEAKVSKLI
ncbi:hypothetical protein Ancab_036504 [Ancistrocladus abbreviatus]